MTEYGFFYVANIPEFSAAEELEYLKEFFALSDEVKMGLAVRKHNPQNSNVYRGYGPVVEGSGTQFKEMFNIGPHDYADPQFITKSEDALTNLKTISKEGNLWPKTGDQ